MAWDMLAKISHEASTKSIWCVGNVDQHIDGSYFTNTCLQGTLVNHCKWEWQLKHTQTAFQILDVRKLSNMSHTLLGIYRTSAMIICSAQIIE
jgi:hypothetical protein